MSSNPIDVHTGSRVRKRRIDIGMSQTLLAGQTRYTVDQIRRYEHGQMRIGASRLYHLSAALDVPISYFFEEIPAGMARTQYSDGLDRQPSLPNLDRIPKDKRGAMKLINTFYRVPDPAIRKHILGLLTALGPPDKARGHRYRPRVLPDNGSRYPKILGLHRTGDMAKYRGRATDSHGLPTSPV